MTRILVAPFGALVRAGLDDLLRHPSTETVHVRDGEDLWARCLEELPDIVVLDLDTADSRAVAERISTEFPALTVIACSGVDPAMRVYPRFHRGESYVSPLGSASTFAAALGS
jgi:DNA-binding NarL/FixJ family response regulator